MNANNWTAASGIGVRELVYGLLTVAWAYKPETVDEDGAVRMLILDAEAFLAATDDMAD